MKSVIVIAAAASTALLGACSTGPLTVEDKCAMAIAQQTGRTARDVVSTGTVDTAAGPRAFFSVGGANYVCQVDTAGNVGRIELQG